jgi:uncharacterized protein YggE
MKKTWLVVIGAVLILGVMGLVGCAGGVNGTLELKGNLNSQQEGIWVNGEGKVTAVPDVAILSLGIESQEATVEAARANAAEAMDSVTKALKDQGIQDKDIQTQYFNIQKVTRWDNDKQEQIDIGYRVSNMVTAKIRNVDKAGTVIDAVVTAGGDLTRVNSIGFTIDDPKPYQEQARELAVADAAAKAEKLAENAGIKLGKATYVAEAAAAPVPAPAPVETPVSPGEMEITTNVQIAYSIAD